jgi:hypothetical protein
VGTRKRAHVLKQLADNVNPTPNRNAMGLVVLVNTGERLERAMVGRLLIDSIDSLDQ